MQLSQRYPLPELCQINCFWKWIALKETSIEAFWLSRKPIRIGAHHIIVLRKGPAKANMKSDCSHNGRTKELWPSFNASNSVCSTQVEYGQKEADVINLCRRNSSFLCIKKENIPYKPWKECIEFTRMNKSHQFLCKISMCALPAFLKDKVGVGICSSSLLLSTDISLNWEEKIIPAAESGCFWHHLEVL